MTAMMLLLRRALGGLPPEPPEAPDPGDAARWEVARAGLGNVSIALVLRFLSLLVFPIVAWSHAMAGPSYPPPSPAGPALDSVAISMAVGMSLTFGLGRWARLPETGSARLPALSAFAVQAAASLLELELLAAVIAAMTGTGTLLDVLGGRVLVLLALTGATLLLLLASLRRVAVLAGAPALAARARAIAGNLAGLIPATLVVGALIVALTASTSYVNAWGALVGIGLSGVTGLPVALFGLATSTKLIRLIEEVRTALPPKPTTEE
jgi:hypothetical protein